MSNFFKTILFLYLFLTAACSTNNSDIASFRAEALHFCSVHTVEYWQSAGKLDELNAMSPTEKQQTLMKEIHLSVKSPEMEAIIFTEGENVEARDYYPYLQKRIPTLTKEPFDCPEIAEFYVSQ